MQWQTSLLAQRFVPVHQWCCDCIDCVEMVLLLTSTQFLIVPWAYLLRAPTNPVCYLHAICKLQFPNSACMLPRCLPSAGVTAVFTYLTLNAINAVRLIEKLWSLLHPTFPLVNTLTLYLYYLPLWTGLESFFIKCLVLCIFRTGPHETPDLWL